jgi:hypothetical protein
MSIFSSTSVKALVISTAITLLLSGCGSSKPDDSLIKSCELLNINLNSLREEPNLYKVDHPSTKFSSSTDDLFLITNSGNKTRQRNKEVISRQFSFMANDFDKAMNFSGNLENDIRFKIFSEAIKNTGFKISLTPSEIASLKGNYDDPSADLVNAEIDRVIGVDLYDEEDNYVGNTGCKLVSSYKYQLENYEHDFEVDDTDFLWTRAEGNIEWAYEVVTFTNICQKDGNYLGNECARNDFVPKGDYDSTLPAPTLGDPWARTWSSKQQEELAKTVWCINNGYRSYNYSKDICTNVLSR